MAKEIFSTFNKNSNGWTLTGDVKSSAWHHTGGDPGGYLGWVDAATGQDSYYLAPSNYLGDKMAFYGGTLSYSILDSGNGYTAYDVKLVGDGKTLEYTSPNDANFPTPNVWSAATVDLVASNFIDTATGMAATAAEMKLVLKDLTELDIRAEYVSGAETGGLDNVYLKGPGASASEAGVGRASDFRSGLVDHAFSHHMLR